MMGTASLQLPLWQHPCCISGWAVVQFLLIIRSSSEDSIRASYSTKVAQLVETYAQPAEYARTMAAVLVAAGNAAPRALASRISGTLALCGEQTVQANTASVFSQLLKAEDPLSDAQLLVCPHFTACKAIVRVPIAELPALPSVGIFMCE